MQAGNAKDVIIGFDQVRNRHQRFWLRGRSGRGVSIKRGRSKLIEKKALFFRNKQFPEPSSALDFEKDFECGTIVLKYYGRCRI